MTAGATVLIPVKNLALAKSRLAEVLPPAGREALARALVRPVVGQARVAAGVEHVVLLSDDEAVGREAAALDVECLAEEARGLNASLEAAIASLVAGGSQEILVLFADLPTVTAAEIEALVASMRTTPADVTLAPSERGGTSALGLPVGISLPLQFGPGSRARFAEAASSAGLRFMEVERPGLYQDLDEPGDIPAVLASPDCAPHVRAVWSRARDATAEE